MLTDKLDSLVQERGKLIYVILIFIYSCIGAMMLISQGYTPSDDALRHSGKVIAGKSWQQILLFDNPNLGDVHHGWHSFLTLINNNFLHSDVPEPIMLFSIAFLFIYAVFLPSLFVKRKDIYIIVMGIFSLVSFSLFMRELIARPLVVSMANLTILLLTWQQLKKDKTPNRWYILYFTLYLFGIYLHPSWYLNAIPFLAFMLAGEIKVAVKFACIIALATLSAAVLSGDFVNFFYQQYYIITTITSSYYDTTQLVGELQPRIINFTLISSVFFLLLVKHLAGFDFKKSINRPSFIIVILCALLIEKATRFWVDIGQVALFVWFIKELTELLEDEIDKKPFKSFVWIIFAFIFSFSTLVINFNGRWTSGRKKAFPSIATSKPELKEWFPGKGGIVYSSSMGVFYEMFYADPKANWRYILGYESAFMPKDDLNTLRDIQWEGGHHLLYKPWIEKMKPEDRLVIYSNPAHFKSEFKQLEWKFIKRGFWFGRLKKDYKPETKKESTADSKKKS
jgi:hypothetical protein